MAEIINLRLKRKEAARVAARQKGDENAAKSGRTRAMKEREALDQARARTTLDGHKLEDQ